MSGGINLSGCMQSKGYSYVEDSGPRYPSPDDAKPRWGSPLTVFGTIGVGRKRLTMGNANRVKRIPWQDVISRIAAAAFGGYALTYAFTACLTLLLPLSKTEAVLTAAMFSFVLYTGAILWAFAASTPRRAWIGLLAPAFGCGAIALPLFLAVVR